MNEEKGNASTNVTAGQIVAIRRRELCWSQEELSWRSDVSRTQIGRIERDESIPSVKSIEKLEKTLGIELYDLFMAQKREQSRRQLSGKKDFDSRNAIDQFEQELIRKGVTDDVLKDVLSEALKSAESKLKRKKLE